jgi:valyl-tRNA synthetase
MTDADAKPTSELPPQYDPKAFEKRAYEMWEQENLFHADPAAGGDPYVIVIPPPNVTGALHMGHGLDNTLQDILIRWRRMQGRNTLWMPGTDHAGIATQTVVEKRILAAEGKTRHQVGREALVKRIWQWKDEYESRIISQLKAMGCSCDWERTRFTLDDVCARAVRATFFRLFRDGLIYRGKRLVNWDPATETTLADDEVEYETVQGHFWHLRYPLTDGSGHLVVATTRPETMLGDTAVAVNPADDRYKHLIGKTVRLPLMNREIPIIADDYVDRETGTGCLKVTPAHDPNDWAIGQRHNLPMVNVLNPNGTINTHGGKYNGLDRFEARKRVVADLEALGLVEKVVEHTHEVGHSYRSHVPIEPYLSDQWYIDVKGARGGKNLAAAAGEAVSSGRVKFHPERYAQTYLAWIENLRDWPISRQLWWGHRIPVWYTPAEVSDEAMAKAFAGRDDVSYRRDSETGVWYVCRREGEFAEGEVPGIALQQDPDVLDTWFSSALWPHSTLGWPADSADLKRYYPGSVLVTAREIITLWVSRMVMMGLYNVGDIPFSDVFIHAVILDEKGQRMSKSKGNGIDPVDIINSYGADAMRFTLAQMTTESQDIRMPVEKDAEGRLTSSKFEIGRNFCNKFWNAARFTFMNLADLSDQPFDRSKLLLEDRWILSRLSTTVRLATEHLDAFRFHDCVDTIYAFFWNDFCDWYLEITKPRMRDAESKVIPQRILAYALDRLLRLAHPFVPHITEALWAPLGKLVADRSLDAGAPAPAATACMIAAWPQPVDAFIDREAEVDFALVQSTIRAIRNIRARMNIAPRQPLRAVIKASPDSVARIRAAAETVRHLATVESLTADPAAEKPHASATELVEGVEVFVPLAGVIDLNVERQRLGKRIAEQQKFREGATKKLANENFVARAKPEVVQAERDRLTGIEAELAVLEANLKDLE